MKSKLSIKFWILSTPFFWHVYKEWDWSLEMDGMRKPRQFLKNKYYKDYMITSVFTNNPYPKKEAVKLFIERYKSGKLLFDRTALIHNKE